MKKENIFRANVLIMVFVLIISVFCAGCGSKTTELSTYEVDEYEDNGIEEIDEQNDDGVENDTATSSKTKKGKSSRKKGKSSSNGFDPFASIPASDKGKTVRLMIWWALSKEEKSVLDDFENEYGIKYKIVQVPLELYSSKLAAMIASNDSPDLCCMSSENFPAPIVNNLVQPITVGKFDLKNDTAYDIEQMNTFKWKGQYYGVQLRNNMTYQRYCLYYNETMFNNRGVKTPYKYWKEGNWNFNTFAELCKKMTYDSEGKKVFGYSGDDTEQLGFILASGIDYVTNTGNGLTNNLKNKTLVDVASRISDLRANGYWDPEDAGTSKFLSGNAAMCGNRTWLMEVNQAFTTQMTDKWSAVPMPGIASKQYVGINPSVWCVAKGAKNVSAASYLIRYWLDYENFDFDKCIKDKTLREVFSYLSNSNDRVGAIAKGVMSYNNTEDYYKLLYASRRSKNDIPVYFESMVPVVDGVIKKIG